MSEDLYAVLGVSPDASEDDIKRAYRKMARKHHPDVNPGDPSAEERFKKLSGAYEVLIDAEKRALYDELGPDAEKIGYDPERAEEYRQWKRRAEASAGFGGYGGGDGSVPDLEELLGELFGQRGRGPRRGRDVEASLEVSFEDAARGARPSVVVDGRQLELTIPAGIESGQRLRLAGQGLPGRDGGPAGDLYVRISVGEHPRFTRDRKDLAVSVPISVPEALVGATIEVPTLGAGKVKLKVPPSAQNGQRLRLRGKGIEPKGEPAGDLYVTLEIAMPKGGAEAARARAAEAIAPLYEGEGVR